MSDHSSLAANLTSLPLFDGCNLPSQRPSEDPLEARRRAEAAAFERADINWRIAYKTFIVCYLARFGPATAEAIRTAYERTDFPQQPHGSKRASGAIFRQLMKSGAIQKAGRELSKLYGNELVRYELATENTEITERS